MPENSTSITYEKVRTDANTIKECSTTMSNIFEEFGSSMNRVGAGDVFAGDASESLGARFTSLKGKFDTYVRLVNDFANTILTASDQTAATEQALANEADNLAG